MTIEEGIGITVLISTGFWCAGYIIGELCDIKKLINDIKNKKK